MALVAIMGISSIAIISCNDEDESRMDKQTTAGVQKAALPPTYQLGLFINDDDTMYCNYKKPGNCLPEVVIVGTRLSSVITDFCRSIDRNTQLIYIERNRPMLEECFVSEDLDAVINGTLELSYKTNDKTFIMFKNIRTSDIVRVYPFVL